MDEQEIGIGSFNKLISHRNLGLGYLEEERYSDGAREFMSFIAIAPKEASGYANLGWIYLQSPGTVSYTHLTLPTILRV